MILNVKEVSASEAYHVLTQAVIPRPVAWVMTENSNGSQNLAPFSFFTPVSSNPPLLMFSVGKKTSGDDKDTWVNIQRSKRFTVHIAGITALDDLNQSSQELVLNDSEVDLLKLPCVSFERQWQRLKDAPVAFACELFEQIPMGNAPQRLIFGEIKHVYVRDDCYHLDEKDRVNISASKINPVARLGASEYAGLGELIRLSRPK